MTEAIRQLAAWQGYLVPGTDVLRNKVGATDERSLAEAERKIVALATADLRARPPELTPEGHREAHRRLFGEVYEWAGAYRTVSLNKETTRFASPERIASAMEASYAQLARESFLKGSDRETFVERATVFLAQWNAVHPFREGNGRTQRVMLQALATSAGHELSFRSISRARMVDASIEASHPRKPGLAALRDVLSEASDPHRLAIFDRMRPLLEALRRDGHFDWNEASLRVARAGERIEGVAALPRDAHYVIRSGSRLVIVTQEPGRDMPKAGAFVSHTEPERREGGRQARTDRLSRSGQIARATSELDR